MCRYEILYQCSSSELVGICSSKTLVSALLVHMMLQPRRPNISIFTATRTLCLLQEILYLFHKLWHKSSLTNSKNVKNHNLLLLEKTLYLGIYPELLVQKSTVLH
jgi:hypothetical protein